MHSRADFETYIEKEAPKYWLAPSEVKRVVACESQWNPNAIGDHGQSHGLVQIHAPTHPRISVSEANDPEYALNYLMSHWYKDHWSCQ